MGVRSDVRVCHKCGRVDLPARMVRLPDDAPEHAARHRCRRCADAARAPPMPLEMWSAAEFRARLWSAPRVVILYHAAWSGESRACLDLCAEADAEASVPVVIADLSHPLDPRWDEQDVRVVPTLAYYESGEELERMAGARGYGLDERDVDTFFALVEDLQEEPPVPRKLRRFSSRRSSRG